MQARQENIGFSPGRVGAFVALTKPRVMSLSVFTALVGMAMAPGAISTPAALFSAIAIALGAGASGALNMWYDAGIDAEMARTSTRPLPSGRLRRGEALGFGLLLSVVSVLLLGAAANGLAAALLAFTIFFYAVIYTMWLKTRTAQNIVIGGAAGALPPVIGWAAVSGSVSLEALILFLIIFLWTPPHFWALALIRKNDYAAVGIPMLPNVAGEDATRRQILIYALLVAPVGVLPWLIGGASAAYALVAAAMGAVFLWKAWQLAQVDDGQLRQRARALFAFSILYLFTLFAVLLIDALAMRLVG